MKSHDFGNTSITKLVFSLAIPSMIAQLVNVLYSIVDRMFVGQIEGIGSLCLAAVGVCGPIVTLLSSFGTWVGIGGSIWMSIRLGQKQEKKASIILWNSFLLLFGISIVLTLVFLFSKEYLIGWFGGSSTVFPYADTYLTIYTLGTFFALMAMGLNYFITCQGYATIAMFTVILGACTNIVLDYVFIKIFNFQIAGAAIATVIAQVLSCVFALCFLRWKSKIRLQKECVDLEGMKEILRLGFSPFVILATDSIILIVMNAVLQKFGQSQGDLYISAITVAQSYFLLITGPLIGITSGTQSIIAYHFGAKNKQKIKEAFKVILLFAFSFCACMWLISKFFAGNFVNLFTQEAQTRQLALTAIQIFCSGILFMSVQYVIVDGITALSHVKLSLVLSMHRKMIYLGCTCLLPVFFGVMSTFYAQPIADIWSSIVSSICFIKLIPKHLERNQVI